MNAGKSFYHEETSEACEALQILIRPEEQDLDSNVQLFARTVDVSKYWKLLAGPKEMEDAPLTIRNRVIIYDARMQAGDSVQIPQVEDFTPWLFVMDCEQQVENTLLTKGMRLQEKPFEKHVQLVKDATLVLFLSDVHS
ncbi:hypothetical protein [Peribacillus frigoritolerans]|uniref:hypothetical protein n=1 Tax=Peribacillus frigoritolerans TaxID=450367 RepID=UPI0030195270